MSSAIVVVFGVPPQTPHILKLQVIEEIRKTVASIKEFGISEVDVTVFFQWIDWKMREKISLFPFLLGCQL
jgi:hypothetical protein